MRLTIDIGNSATKATLWQDDTAVASETAACAADVMLRRLCDGVSVRAAIVSAVREIPEGFLDTVSEIAPLTLLTADTPVPLVNGYASPATLGADRLAAAVGAASLAPGRELLVADLGTAATFDHVTADGRYTGGNIAPGLRLRLEALHRWTSRLPELTIPADYRPDAPFATDTRTAMLNGALLGLAAEIAGYRARLAPDTLTVLTGGDAAIITPLLDFETVTDPHLVGRGLNRISLYNET